MKNEYFPYLVGIFAGVNECSFRNSCLSWLDLTFLWPKVAKNYGVPKIHVFLHPEMLEFHVVGELSCRGLLTGNRMLNFIPFCYWKVAKITGKIYIFWAILTCVVHALSESESFSCWGQGRKLTCT